MVFGWDVIEIVEAVEAGLRSQAQACDAEQAVYGIDGLDELELHPMIQDSLKQATYGVWPEQRYPSHRPARPRRRRSEGQRCDIVLTSDTDQPLVEPDAEATLFAEENALPLEAAYWLEIKTVSQFTTEGPFPHYSKELLSPVARDIRKLADDPLIFHAGLLLILFTADQSTAEHDLQAWEQRCLRRGLPVAPPVARHFKITDRLGNGITSVGLFPVRRL